MKRIHLLAFVLLGNLIFPCFHAVGQSTSSTATTTTLDNEYALVPLNISFVPPLSISHAVRASSGKKVANFISGNVLVGWADRLAGVEGSGIWGAYSDDSFGIQGAGIGNSIGGSFEGIQGAGIVNIVGGSLRGLQGAGVMNITGGNMNGVQSAGVINIADGGIDGVQAAGVLNIAHSTTAGIQAAGVGNIAGTMDGVQIASIFNSAKEMNGLHIALFNFAERGTGVPIGLFSFVSEAGMKVELSGDELGFANIFFRTGTRNFANYLGVGTRVQQWWRQMSFTYGLGAEFELTPAIVAGVDGFASLLADFGTGYYTYTFGQGYRIFRVENGAGLLRLRSTLGLDVFPGFRIFGGVAVNWIALSSSDGREFGVNWSFMDTYNGSVYQRFTPGFVFGVRLF